MERRNLRWRESNWDEKKKFNKYRKKLRWAKMGKVEGFIKPVETQMASSLQGLGKGQDFTFYVFPFILHPCRGWRVKILRFMFFLLILHRCRGWRVKILHFIFFPSFSSLQELESQDLTFFSFSISVGLGGSRFYVPWHSSFEIWSESWHAIGRLQFLVASTKSTLSILRWMRSYVNYLITTVSWLAVHKSFTVFVTMTTHQHPLINNWSDAPIIDQSDPSCAKSMHSNQTNDATRDSCEAWCDVWRGGNWPKS